MTIEERPLGPTSLQHNKSRPLLSSPAARLLTVALLFLAVLLPRLVGLGEATTEDEDQWILRTGNFARALGAGEWRGTFQIGHPGVTTMWLTTLALGRERAERFANQVRGERLVTQVEDFLPALRTARLPFALLNALLVTACGLLAARLFGTGPGLLAGLLLALDPYWSAMSPIVGMDSLLAGFTACSLLSAMLAFGQSGRADARGSGGAPSPPLPLASGFLTGLAIMTKAPGLFILPIIALLAGLEMRRPGLASWRPVAFKLLFWTLGLLAAALIWPAMWADPFGTVRRTLDFARDTGSTPHGPGNYFAGHPVVDPGPLFYPVALGLRLGPATVLGLLLLSALAVPRRWLPPMAILAAFAGLFGLALTVSPKKVDRYILPLFPALTILAALGWWLAIRRLERWLRQRAVDGGRRTADVRSSPTSVRGPLSPVLLSVALVGLLQAWPLIDSAPHPLSAFNPLFGGTRAAQWALPVGWGEGLDQVGDYLRSQPNADSLVTGVWFPLYVNFQAHAPGRVVSVTFSRPGRVGNQPVLDQADFYVDYIHARQRELTPQPLADRRPDFVVTVNGLEYARVYRLKR